MQFHMKENILTFLFHIIIIQSHFVQEHGAGATGAAGPNPT